MFKHAIWKSKTFWTSLIGALIGFLAIITPDFLQGMGFTEENKVKILTFVGAATTLLNIIFKFVQIAGAAAASNDNQTGATK